MQDARRTILTRVARGELSPDEGASLLDELEHEHAGVHSQTQTRTDSEPDYQPTGGAGPIKAVRIERSFGGMVVIGDPEVREAVAEGPHRAERQGDLLVIRSGSDEEGGFVFGPRGERWRWRWDAFQMYAPSFRTLRVRVNPDLALQIVTQAGSLRVQGVRGRISGEIQAGTAVIEDFRGPLDLSLQAGSFRGTGILAAGESHIRSEAGSIRLHLQRGSSVRVRAHSTMGRIVLGSQEPADVFVLGGSGREMTVGGGESTLDLDATMGSVRVTAD